MQSQINTKKKGKDKIKNLTAKHSLFKTKRVNSDREKGRMVKKGAWLNQWGCHTPKEKFLPVRIWSEVGFMIDILNFFQTRVKFLAYCRTWVNFLTSWPPPTRVKWGFWQPHLLFKPQRNLKKKTIKNYYQSFLRSENLRNKLPCSLFL